MGIVVAADPFSCRVWGHHDRLEEHITEQTCKLEIESFIRHGQLVPALGRRIFEDNYKYELIYGARRLFVARYLNRPLLLETCELSDREALIAMDIENRQRRDISPYERGQSYARWLRNGEFRSQEELADALCISTSQVSRLLKLARLPSVIVDAFEAATDICEGWGLEIASLLEDSGARRAAIHTAREIAAIAPRPPAREVYRKLIASAGNGRKPKPSVRDSVVKGADGSALFRVRHHLDSIAIVLPLRQISMRSLDRITAAVASILEGDEESPGIQSATRAHIA